MNLYKLHSEPKSLDHYEDAQESVPEFVWAKYEKDKDELKKREDIWARDAGTAYRYADKVLKRPFPKGEDAIATNSQWAYLYAQDVLKGPFPKGENAIAKDASWAYYYALNGLKKRPFPKGENTILNSEYKNDYLKLIGKLK